MGELTRAQVAAAVISGRGPAYLRGVDLSSLDLSTAGWLAGADLRRANLSQANLSRADLSGANLERANLHRANLAGANLEAADLGKAGLSGANLRMANLRGANLRGANLLGALLMKANLREADLEGADLEGANLEGADLTNARLNVAKLTDARLDGANLQGASLFGTSLAGERKPPEIEIPPRGFSGIVSAINLTDLLQLVCLSRADLTVSVMTPDAEGRIYVRAGKVCHARIGALEAEEAFLEMLRWDNGRFETSPLQEGQPTTITKPLEHLIIDAMRESDEKKLRRRSDYRALIQAMKEHLPISAYPHDELMELISRKGKDIGHDKRLLITDAFDAGESGGIFCSVSVDDEVFIAPLDYLGIEEDHPLVGKVLEYQEEFA